MDPRSGRARHPYRQDEPVDGVLAKAHGGSAEASKDAAAIENITPGEALEKLLMAIESGASRGLRTMGIFVDLKKEVEQQEKLTGKTLDENEVTQLRYNAVMKEAAKIQGAAAAASGSAEAQSKALAREVNELREVIGGRIPERQLRLAGEVRAGRDAGCGHPRHLRPRD